MISPCVRGMVRSRVHQVLTPQDLVVILAIADAGTVTGAADQLATSQPALSRTLRTLERRLGGELFERRPQGMVPTPLGEAMAAYGRAVSAVTERAARELRTRLETDTTEILAGVVPHISVAPVARTVVAAHGAGHVRVHIEVGPEQELLAALERGTIDLYIGPLPEGSSAFAADPLFEDHPALAVRRKHPVVGSGRELELEQLLEHPWVMPPADDPVVDRITALFRDAGLEPPTPAATTADVALATSITMQSDFIAVLPRDAALLSVSAGQLVILPVALPGRGGMVGVLRRRQRTPKPEVDFVVSTLRAAVERAGLRATGG